MDKIHVERVSRNEPPKFFKEPTNVTSRERGGKKRGGLGTPAARSKPKSRRKLASLSKSRLIPAKEARRMLCEQLGKSVVLHAAIRDLLAFYDRVAGTGGQGGKSGKSGESWSTTEVLRLNEIRALTHPGIAQAAQDARKPS